MKNNIIIKTTQTCIKAQYKIMKILGPSLYRAFENGYLIRKGDVIISVDGNKVEKFTDIAKQIEKKKAGDVLDVTVNRNGAIFNKSITLELPPRL